VVQPWRGPHHVYGLFEVPDRFREARRFAVTISVQGAMNYCMWVEGSTRYRWQHVVSEHGTDLVRQYVPTRVALWFLVKGRLGDLRSPENWAIVFSDRRL